MFWHNSHCAVGPPASETDQGLVRSADTGSSVLPAMIAPRTYTHTLSQLPRQAKTKLRHDLPADDPAPAENHLLVPPLHAAECDATRLMKLNAASPNLPYNSCTKGTSSQRSALNAPL
jgi:hypothetical protein